MQSEPQPGQESVPTRAAPEVFQTPLGVGSTLPPCCSLTVHLEAHVPAALWAKSQGLNYPVAVKEEHHFFGLHKTQLHMMKRVIGL